MFNQISIGDYNVLLAVPTIIDPLLILVVMLRRHSFAGTMLLSSYILILCCVYAGVHAVDLSPKMISKYV